MKVLHYFFTIVPITYMALFQVVNPIGSGILFLNLTPTASNALRRKLARKVAFNSSILLLIVLLVGVYVLNLFGITVPIVQICGGMLIVAMGWRSINSKDDATSHEGDKKVYLTGELTPETDYVNQAFYPMTFPFTIGPGSIAITLTISAEYITHANGNDILEYSGAIISILLIALTIYICFGSADLLMSKLSLQIRRVVMKLLSFILLCIGGQIVFNGIEAWLHTLPK
ncbi:MAG TPA: NAAT family transporter [Dinghuibacter sp.]|uniref:MarC family protein n=1 Tax=Dinghuibacter sp. TaxID=2024697 RepID=UPI002B7A2B03|nr:NAAT family transporter [Dinghuibacter sp.]HTJ13880.1 NAAT family transporter [Dinghuibacter sp.]